MPVTERHSTEQDWTHLQGPPEFSPGDRRLVLIASYPRSGSNWIGRTLEHVLLGRVGWINPLSRGRRGIYHDLDRFIATGRLDELTRWSVASSLVLKTHRTPGAIERDAPGVLERADLVVGVLRGPLDVMASVFRFLLWSGQLTSDGKPVGDLELARRLGLVEPFIESFIAARGHVPFEAMGFGTWSSHAEAWSAALGGASGLRLLYKDLKRDARPQLSRVFEGLGLDVTGQQIDDALALASPEQIGAQFGPGFVHAATDGSYSDFLTSEQRALALAVFASDIERYGLDSGTSSPSARST